MAIAVVNHEALVQKANKLGFPLSTKVSCQAGFNGYVIWDAWIRENIQWVSELGFDPLKHVRITESAQLVGELPNDWQFYSQKFIEGTDDFNAFKVVVVDGVSHDQLVNAEAIQVAIHNASLSHVVDFDTDETNAVVTHNKLAIAIFQNAEDSSLSYQSELEVAQIWTTKVEHIECKESDTNTKPLLFKRAYARDPIQEESYPWIEVGELTTEEYSEWAKHNLAPTASIEETLGNVSKSLGTEFSKSNRLVHRSDNSTDIKRIDRNDFFNIWSNDAISYSTVDDSSVSGDI